MSFIPGGSDTEDGAVGMTTSPDKCGLVGRNEDTSSRPIEGPGGSGIFGLTRANGGAGVFGANNHPLRGRGVQGNGPEVGVAGFSEAGVGLLGQSVRGDGAQGFTDSHMRNGILGRNNSTERITEGYAGPPVGNGVFGYTDVPNCSGVVGAVHPDNAGGAGITGLGPTAGRFFGKVTVSGDTHISGNAVVAGDVQLTGADCAEKFVCAEVVSAEPGTVMVMDERGALCPCSVEYDHKVAGIVSGAGDLRPGIVLGTCIGGHRPSVAIALIGRANCKVDADYGEIAVGDLLTTSPTTGHAMRASDRMKSFGAVVGKAMAPLHTGRGLIPVLVAMQ